MADNAETGIPKHNAAASRLLVAYFTLCPYRSCSDVITLEQNHTDQNDGPNRAPSSDEGVWPRALLRSNTLQATVYQMLNIGARRRSLPPMTRPSRAILQFVNLTGMPLLVALFLLGFHAATAHGSDPPRPRTSAAVIDDEDRQFWSFRALKRPAVPTVVEISRARTPIDRFVLAALEQEGLSFSPDAERRAVRAAFVST